MCLAIPLKVLNVLNDNILLVESGGININVSCALISDVKKGDYVLVHAGFAIQKMTESEAKETLSVISGE